jgi:hypothetical protein
MMNNFTYASPIKSFEKVKGSFYVALHKESAIHLAGSTTVLEGHQEPVIHLKRIGNTGQLVSMGNSSTLVWDTNKNPPHCVAVLGTVSIQNH